MILIGFVVPKVTFVYPPIPSLTCFTSISVIKSFTPPILGATELELEIFGSKTTYLLLDLRVTTEFPDSPVVKNVTSTVSATDDF